MKEHLTDCLRPQQVQRHRLVVDLLRATSQSGEDQLIISSNLKRVRVQSLSQTPTPHVNMLTQPEVDGKQKNVLWNLSFDDVISC